MPLSKFDYEYDALGRISKWTRMFGPTQPEVMSLDYNLEDQLLGAVIAPQGGSTIKG